MMRNLFLWFRNLNRAAALDSLRDVLAVVGFGSILADFSTMQAIYFLPALAFFALVWYADYMRHDLPGPALAEPDAKERRMLAQIAELGR